jgi:thiol-disulfide isomerase/thioredoxin
MAFTWYGTYHPHCGACRGYAQELDKLLQSKTNEVWDDMSSPDWDNLLHFVKGSHVDDNVRWLRKTFYWYRVQLEYFQKLEEIARHLRVHK